MTNSFTTKIEVLPEWMIELRYTNEGPAQGQAACELWWAIRNDYVHELYREN